MVKKPLSINAEITHKYDDIIHMEYPFPGPGASLCPKMPASDRAKIFAPFAALKGYGEAIAKKQKVVVPKIELSEESKEYLDLQLAKVAGLLKEKKHPVISVVYFQGDNQAGGMENGEYIRITGAAVKIDTVMRVLQVVEKKIRLDDICSIEGEDLS